MNYWKIQDIFHERMKMDYERGVISNPIFKPYFEWKFYNAPIKSLTRQMCYTIMKTAQNELEALGNGLLHGSVGTLKGVSRKKVIDYDPKKSIKQLAELNGVTIPTIRKFIIEKNIDRNRDEKLNTYNKIWFEYIKDSDVSRASLAKKLKMSVNTIKEYLGKDAKEIAVGEGKIGMASEHPLVKELREDISNLKKRFDKFCMIRELYDNLSAGEYLKRLGWSDDKEGRNLALVVNFMNMREFMYKFKDKGIEFIHN